MSSDDIPRSIAIGPIEFYAQPITVAPERGGDEHCMLVDVYVLRDSLGNGRVGTFYVSTHEWNTFCRSQPVRIWP